MTDLFLHQRHDHLRAAVYTVHQIGWLVAWTGPLPRHGRIVGTGDELHCGLRHNFSLILEQHYIILPIVDHCHQGQSFETPPNRTGNSLRVGGSMDNLQFEAYRLMIAPHVVLYDLQPKMTKAIMGGNNDKLYNCKENYRSIVLLIFKIFYGIIIYR